MSPMSEKLSGLSDINMRPKVLVYGWYFRGNIGDNLFIDAFRYLFPELDLVFTDSITLKHLEGASAVFFGGGSFLYAVPDITDDALLALSNIPIFYIGVGGETEIHSIHYNLLSRAKLIATRSKESVAKFSDINKNTMHVPDIAFSLQSLIKSNKKIGKSVLVLPNFEVVPQWNSPQWKSAAWEYFKSEFSQFLDSLYESKFNIKFFSLCTNPKINDDWAATEIINKMSNRSDHYILKSPAYNMSDISLLISQFDLIITQRYHGIILSEMTGVPYMTIHHHDKLKNAFPHRGKSLSYYGVSKQKLFDEFNSTLDVKFDDVLPIESNIFEGLKKTVLDIISNGR